MPLADDLAGLAASNYRGPRCATGATLRALPDADQQAITDALARGIPATQVADVLKSWNVPITANSLIRHTKGRCQCPTTSDDSPTT